MSGDVFGNGVLLSKHIKLVAAFDHRHIIIDPHPDPARSWEERERLFALPRSSWADYEPAVDLRGWRRLSAQSEVHRDHQADAHRPRHRQVGRGTATCRVDQGLPEGSRRLVVERRHRHLRQGADRDQRVVGDKANDALRVDGCEVRAKCVGEGGNLGLTQLGRIEYAMQGGRINTDFIDNSAGVDTSDYEVNIKILLTGEVSAGRLSWPTATPSSPR